MIRIGQGRVRRAATTALLAVTAFLSAAATAADVPASWRAEWPETDFTKRAVDLGEIMSGGPPRDGIPSIDRPRFVPAAEEDDLATEEPVIGLAINGDARAYPLRVLTWHEIANDTVGGVPVVVTYCPLCNAAIAFKRELDGQTLSFGTTGKLRHSDLVMYDRETESWWQQYLGRAIVGELTGRELELVPVRLESWERFKSRHPKGRVLVPRDPDARPYGQNPYVGYDSAARPFLYAGDLPDSIEARQQPFANVRVRRMGHDVIAQDIERDVAVPVGLADFEERAGRRQHTFLKKKARREVLHPCDGHAEPFPDATAQLL